MKKPLFKISKASKARIIRFADGILSTATLLFILRAFTTLASKEPSLIDYCIVYLLISVSYILQAVQEHDRNKLGFRKFIGFAIVHAAVGIAVMIIDINIASVIILLESILLIILTNRIIAAISADKVRGRVLNILFALAAGAFAVSAFFITEDQVADFLSIHMFLTAAKALGHVIVISFSQMRIGVLRKILRKTFAAEILFGLVLLIVSFSSVFHVLEDSIATYTDALWYCFAVVTTIGFGDLSVVTPVSRVLSVILGVYGIVVVALITSVIVNFYNEVKDEKSDEDDAPDTDAQPADQEPQAKEEKPESSDP